MPKFSMYDRLSYVTIDSLGVDPLSCTIDLSSIKTSTPYTVTPDTQYRPDLIAWDKLNQAQLLWWVVLRYNKLGSAMELITGTVIQIPDVTQLTTLLAQQSGPQTSYRQILI
jgi:hypothetical protein